MGIFVFTISQTMDEQRIIDEYTTLLERSQQLFSGLREVPQFGKQWQPYFQRTFEVYTKLWKFQQVHRSVLENRDKFGLTRQDIGELASKIGQLYYHYYLRTSETDYLVESFIFYEAIRNRAYFKDGQQSPGLMVKKLRYYARFIVVCLLLNKTQVVENLVTELTQYVDIYVKNFHPTDAQEWQFVLQEITTFLKADNVLAIENGSPISRRLNIKGTDDFSRIRLQEAILVGNSAQQIKFSELTLDMFRMMQALEKQTNSQQDDKGSDKESLGDSDRQSSKVRRNPHKYLLYRPTITQMSVFMANCFKELQDNNVMLFYLSADGINAPCSDPNILETLPADVKLCKKGGVALNSRRPNSDIPSNHLTSDCLYPEDLLPYTRKHMFLIVDSDNAQVFADIPSLYGKQFMCLMAPPSLPEELKDATKTGNLFTYFLTEPLAAFCCTTGIQSISKELYDSSCAFYQQFSHQIQELLLSHPQSTATSFQFFIQEDFLCQLLTNFVFCVATFVHHKYFQHNLQMFLPQCTPNLPAEFFHHRVLQEAIYELAQSLHVSDKLI